MTTQPEQAVGNEATAPAAAASNPFEDIAAEMLGEEQEEEPAPQTEGDEPETEQAEADADDLDDEDEAEAGLPPIEPPHSLNAEDKEAFKKLPREAQEFTARRIGEMEKGFNTKAQEAAQAKEAARTEALQFATQLKAEAAQRLSEYAKMFEVRPPDAALFRTNPDAYAQQLEAYQYATVQREQAQREAEQARGEQAQYQTALQQHEAQQFRQRLEAELPEAFGEGGQKFIGELAATAEALGYDDNAITQSSVEELKALKAVSEWKAKADRFDKAMAKKMERVRSGKNPPPISKPGVSRGASASRQAKVEQSWQNALTAKTRNARESALAEWAEGAGYLD